MAKKFNYSAIEGKNAEFIGTSCTLHCIVALCAHFCETA